METPNNMKNRLVRLAISALIGCALAGYEPWRSEWEEPLKITEIIAPKLVKPNAKFSFSIRYDTGARGGERLCEVGPKYSITRVYRSSRYEISVARKLSTNLFSTCLPNSEPIPVIDEVDMTVQAPLEGQVTIVAPFGGVENIVEVSAE